MRRFDWFVVAALALMAVGNVAMFIRSDMRLAAMKSRHEALEWKAIESREECIDGDKALLELFKSAFPRPDSTR